MHAHKYAGAHTHIHAPTHAHTCIPVFARQHRTGVIPGYQQQQQIILQSAWWRDMTLPWIFTYGHVPSPTHNTSYINLTHKKSIYLKSDLEGIRERMGISIVCVYVSTLTQGRFQINTGHGTQQNQLRKKNTEDLERGSTFPSASPNWEVCPWLSRRSLKFIVKLHSNNSKHARLFKNHK